jgi:adenine-specific DNA-methyltransferase
MPPTISTFATHGVKYIGSKAALLDEIHSFVAAQLPAGAPRTFLDVFTGTTRVAQSFRAAGWQVTSSDLSWASEAYAHAFLLRTPDSSRRIPDLLARLRALMEMPAAGAQPGWIETNYCDVIAADGGIVKMWKPANGRKADRVRDAIAAWEAAGEISHREAMILVACLLFALDKVDSSVGVQQAYLKSWAARANNTLALEDLPYPNGAGVGVPGQHLVGDALKLVYPPASVAYLDPPYSAHSYSTYYHIWDSITRWDKPAVGLKTNRRIDRVSGAAEFDPAMQSPWNSKGKALGAFIELVGRLPARYVCISYNDESLVPLETLEGALKEKYGGGAVTVKRIPYKRNIMCQIGNAEGKAAEGEAKTENHEVLIWVNKTVAAPQANS